MNTGSDIPMAFTVGDVLRIWAFRLGMAERGITHPSAGKLAAMRTLVASLEAEPAEALVTLVREDEAKPSEFAFVVNGRVIARMDVYG